MNVSRILAVGAIVLCAMGVFGVLAVSKRGAMTPAGVFKGGALYRCPEGMSLVYDLADMGDAFCIDTWEVQVEGYAGTDDQFSADAVRSAAIAVSREGVRPASATSFDMASAICRNTPVFNSDGVEVGRKRLPTSAEWGDAADGKLGPGGSEWPYGDRFDEERCVTLTADGKQVWDSFQPTGSMANCVSAFGVYDLSGNLWEWADPGLTLDVDRWFEVAAAAGVEVSTDDDGYILLGESTNLKLLRMNIVGVPDGHAFRDPSGYMLIHADQLPPQWLNGPPAYRGYIVLSVNGLKPAEGYLPVEIKRMERSPDSPAHLLLLREHSGAPVTDKRGGAYYTGMARANSTNEPYLGHFHDFTGTIGFRCMTGPLVRRYF